MERLIYSNATPSKFHSNSPIFRQLVRFHLPRKLAPCFSATTWSPWLLRSESRPISSISCNLHGSDFLSADCVDITSSPEDLPNGQEPKHDVLNKILQKPPQQQNVFNTGTVILLSAICLTLFYHPALVSPAFASFPSVVGSGSSAVASGGGLIRSELVSSAWTGLLAGCLHTLSGPDHLAALAPLSIGRTRMESAAVGALWGCGHDAGQLIFGLLFLLLKDRLHIEVIRTWGTRVVGLTLLIIGAMGIREASEVPAPCVAVDDAKLDVSGYEALPNPTIGKKKIGFATFATGIVHGLQPDALMMILPALALPSRLAGAAFLFMFLIGTVVAMGSYTVFIGSCSQALKDRVPRITEKLTWASSLVAIALGVAILVSQVFGFSLY
ncbi:chloroplast protein FOR GROWTH AND FERTILITY 2-like [Primulina huaijiensis]|uniref:chloroplast protein FOR GROWTH AND FERTILITY 2-like n=1 Tax=Primulina huaijiensis TaxID=1492673 RepID=UPI003CC73353